MLFIFGSACAFLLSCLYYTKPSMAINLLLSKIYYYFVFLIIGCRGILSDIVYKRYNKIALPHMPHKVAIVTGGSRGLGASVVKLFLKCDMEVIIACRTRSAGEKLISQIRESGITTGKAKVYQLDNASFQSVHKFANEIKQNYNKIHILINNAGLMFVPYEETEDGFELQWGVNYLSHFLLTALLLPLLKAGSNSEDYSRVVNVASIAYHSSCINFDDVNYKKNFITQAGYGQSKLAQIMSTQTLQNLFQEKQLGVQVYSVHPGIVATEIFKNSQFDKLTSIFRYLIKSPEQGAMSIVYAAVSEEIRNRGGIYISNCKEASLSSRVSDKSTQERLFKLSLEQVKLNDFFQYLK